MIHHTSRTHRKIGVATLFVGVAGLIGCSSDDEPASQAEAAPATAEVDSPPATTPTTPATTATVEATTGDSTVEDTSGPAVEEWSMDAAGPGTFQTAVMEPGFALTYGDGWVPFQPESRNQLNIDFPESTEFGCAPCAFLSINAVEADSTDDVIAFAESNGIEFADPVSIDIGGIDAQRYDAISGEGDVFETEFAEFGLDTAESAARIAVLESGGRVIVIVDLAMPDVADTFQPLSDEVIASIEWSDG